MVEAQATCSIPKIIQAPRVVGPGKTKLDKHTGQCRTAEAFPPEGGSSSSGSRPEEQEARALGAAADEDEFRELGQCLPRTLVGGLHDSRCQPQRWDPDCIPDLQKSLTSVSFVLWHLPESHPNTQVGICTHVQMCVQTPQPNPSSPHFLQARNGPISAFCQDNT